MGKASSRSDEKTRADRKFEKKVKFYELVRGAVASKAITKRKQSRQKKLKAYDLSTLSEYLPKFKAKQKPEPAEFKLKCKTRNNLVLKESNQLKTVISNPVFQSDPLSAIYHHLQNTQPVTDEKPKSKDKKAGKRKRKKKSTSLQAMEI